MPEARFTAACVQMRSGRDPAANRDAAVAGVREAAVLRNEELAQVLRERHAPAQVVHRAVAPSQLAVRKEERVAERLPERPGAGRVVGPKSGEGASRPRSNHPGSTMYLISFVLNLTSTSGASARAAAVHSADTIWSERVTIPSET